jgi:hypothetical protein
VSIGKLKQYKQKMCEACGLIKQPCYGLASEGKKRWCLGCGKAKGVVLLQRQKKKKCDGCGLRGPSYRLPSERKARWCAGCGVAEGAVSVQQMCEGCGAVEEVVHL